MGKIRRENEEDWATSNEVQWLNSVRPHLGSVRADWLDSCKAFAKAAMIRTTSVFLCSGRSLPVMEKFFGGSQNLLVCQ